MKSHFFLTLIISSSLFSIEANVTVVNRASTASTVSTVSTVDKEPIPTNKTKIASQSSTKAHGNVPTSPEIRQKIQNTSQK